MVFISGYVNRMMKIIRLAIEKLIQLNIFLDVKTLQERNKKKIRDQVLATRIYLLLFITCLIILVLFNSLATKMISVTVFKPSINTYDRLYGAHSDTLTCPCGGIAVLYSDFISMEYVQHPVRFLI